jgi:hypothetical protein
MPGDFGDGGNLLGRRDGFACESDSTGTSAEKEKVGTLGLGLETIGGHQERSEMEHSKMKAEQKGTVSGNQPAQDA